ncbi:MAG: hypothetical protein K8Q89_09065 [Nitrosarchaeum sp.]|nr:hypothetical protein [Nitrosarchaeum sp.]
MKYLVIFLFLIVPIGVSFALEPQSMASDNHVMINLHQTKSMDNLEVTFSEIDDSRCPSDVTCVWEGRASVTLHIYDHLQNQTIILTTNETPSKNVGVYKISLIDILPYPVSTKNISQDYVVIISISKNQSETILLPLKQFKNGVKPELVECNSGLSLIIKNNDGHPACVKPETKARLIDRNWATNVT